MDFKKLLKFASLEDKRLRDKYSHCENKETMILAELAKIGEEFGELSSEVLAHLSLVRAEKLANHSKESTEGEFADVVLTTLILAQSMSIDIEKSLKDKMKKINKRYSL